MKSLNKFVSAIVIQSLGSGAIFLTVFLVARILGPVEQGKFSEAKALVDLMVVALLLGLPQSFIYGINKLSISRRYLSRWSMGYGATVFAAVMFFSSGFSFEEGILSIPRSMPFAGNALLAVSVGGLIIHGLLRSVLLTSDDGWRFSLITILPAVFLFAASSLLLVSRVHFDPLVALATSGALSGFFCIKFVHNSRYEKGEATVPWKKLTANAGTAFTQSTVMALQPYITISLLLRGGGGYEDVAFFSIAAYVYQAAILPLTMVAPLLFNRWSSAISNSSVALDLRTLFFPLVVLGILVIVGWKIIPLVVPVVFGPSYEGATRSIQIILLGVPFMYIAYVGIPALMAIGKFKINALMATSRLATCSLILFSLLLHYPGHDKSQHAAIAWMAAECMMALMVLAALAKHFYMPLQRGTDSSSS